jgi:hypothetical protein
MKSPTQLEKILGGDVYELLFADFLEERTLGKPAIVDSAHPKLALPTTLDIFDTLIQERNDHE